MKQLEIYAKTVEPEARQQIEDMANGEAYKDCCIRIMPDVHAGKGCTIGTVIALKDKVIPNTVGVDIGCGVLVVPLGDQHIDMQKLDDVIHEHIPSGFNVHNEPICEFPMYDKLYCGNVMDRDLAFRSLGSLGGGNHFIEIGMASESFKCLIIHTGSRNLGVRVCNYYQNLASHICPHQSSKVKSIVDMLKAAGRHSEISEAIRQYNAAHQAIPKHLAFLEGQNKEHYLHDMRICQEYAKANRRCIADIIMSCMGLEATEKPFETIHNYIDLEHNILRKGAVAAYAGQRLIIPINMKFGSLLCIGKGSIDWLYSAPHGAGRLMSRQKAREVFDVQAFQQEMEGVFTTSVCKETLDESPGAYKPAEEIMDLLSETVTVVGRLQSIYNFKATEPIQNYYKK